MQKFYWRARLQDKQLIYSRCSKQTIKLKNEYKRGYLERAEKLERLQTLFLRTVFR